MDKEKNCEVSVTRLKMFYCKNTKKFSEKITPQPGFTLKERFFFCTWDYWGPMLENSPFMFTKILPPAAVSIYASNIAGKLKSSSETEVQMSFYILTSLSI